MKARKYEGSQSLTRRKIGVEIAARLLGIITTKGATWSGVRDVAGKLLGVVAT